MKIDLKVARNRVFALIIILVFVLGLTIGMVIRTSFDKHSLDLTQDLIAPQVQEGITQTAQEGNWETIKKFSSSSEGAHAVTGEFHIPTSYWRIIFEAEAIEEVKYVGFTMHIIPVEFEEVGFIAPKTCEKSCYGIARTRIYYIHEGPGDFYVEVTPFNLKSWSIQVQIQK